MSIEDYLTNTRIVAHHPPEAAQRTIYENYDASLRQAFGVLATELPPLHITNSLQRETSLVEYDNSTYFVVDQHLGGTLNTLNRLYLNARRKMDAVMVGLRLVAEWLLVKGNQRGAFVSAFNYQELAQEHPLTYLEELPENTARRTVYTATHEAFMMARVLASAALRQSLGDTTGPAFVKAATAQINAVAQALFGGALGYTPFENTRLLPIPRLADDELALDYVRDVLATLVATAVVRDQAEAAARPAIVFGLDILTRHLALLDAIDQLCERDWEAQRGLNPRFARRRTNIRSTMKAMRDQYFPDEPGVDISEIDGTYEQVILEPMLGGVFGQVQGMLGHEVEYMNTQQISPELLSVAAITEMVGFRR